MSRFYEVGAHSHSTLEFLVLLLAKIVISVLYNVGSSLGNLSIPSNFDGSKLLSRNISVVAVVLNEVRVLDQRTFTHKSCNYFNCCRLDLCVALELCYGYTKCSCSQLTIIEV